ncbi:polyprotein [Bat picornavirus]|uniref:Genome polyprotein n=1 Tax=diresapivirus A1 TaxID=2849728 RepID=A0A0D3MDN0_9PICO|nr:polyprotein [Bat picornavirus]AIF74249.1 polyprotein [diresapivirus A1]
MGKVQTNSAGSNEARINAGGSVVMNFYGSTHANAYNEAKSQLSGFLDKTDVKGNNKDKKEKTILGTIMSKLPKIPKLMGPTVEEMGYSDRLLQLTKGNSTVTTQEAADALVAYGEYPKRHTTGEAIDMETYPGVAAERFYVIGTYTWGNTQATNHSWVFPLPRSISDMGIFGQNLSYHYLYNCGFIVHVQINASKFHSGCMLVSMIPEHENTTQAEAAATPFTVGEQVSLPFKKINQVPIFPHQYINLRTNNSATIIYPYTNSYPSDFAGTHDFVTLMLSIVAPLQYSTGAATTVCMTVSVAPLEASFSGLRHGVRLQGIPAMGVPGSNEFASTVRNEGIPVYPEFEKVQGFVNPGRVENFLQVLQRPTLCTFDGVPYLKVTNKAYEDKAIVAINVSLLATQFADTYLANFVRNYSNYRGSLILNFMFVGTAMATGKFIICYTPAGSDQPATRKNAMLGTHLVWDIGLQSTAHFVVPYISTTQYRYINDADSVLGQDGYVTMFYQTALVYPPGNPNESHIVVTLSAGEDFRLRMPFTSNIFQGETEEGTPALDALEIGITEPSVNSTIQIRPNLPQFSLKEMDVEYLYSRYFQIFKDEVTTGYKVITLKFGHKHFKMKSGIQTLFDLFTYFKFDLDFVIKIVGGLTDYQVAYNPPHTTPPNSATDSLWDVILSPNIINSNWQPPSCIRVPYPSVAAYLSSFYDGRLSFNTAASSNYGDNPGNNLGIISVRALTAPSKAYTLMVYMRPVNIEVYCPRPIINGKSSINEVREVHGLVNGFYEKFELKNPFDYMDDKDLQNDQFSYKSFFPIRTDKTITSGVFIKPNMLVIPLHCYGGNLIMINENGEKRHLNVIEIFKKHESDLAFITVDYRSEHVIPIGRGMPIGKGFVLHISPLVGHHSKRIKQYNYHETIDTGEDVHNIIEVPAPSQPGYCGSILVAGGYVHGIQVAGNENFSCFSSFVRIVSGSVVRREAHSVRDYFVNIGDGLGEGFKKQLNEILDRIESRMMSSMEQTVVEKCIKLLIKVISSMCIIMNSKEPITSGVALAAMFSSDFITMGPIMYLKEKISKLLGFSTEIEEQGLVDWMKDFNVACNAAKGLDWLWKQISIFVDWITNKIKVEAPKRRRFNELLIEWPSMMEEMDAVSLNRGKYTEESVIGLCKKVAELKQLCDVYGVERSFSIGQVLKYNNMAMKWMSNLGKSRIEPVAVLIHGGPGQGKSVATELIAKAICRKLDAQLPYSLPPDPKHFDGYTQQEVVIMDDVCQNPDGEDIKLLCQMISTTQFIPPMASLEEKGMPYTSKFFLASTNQNRLRPVTISEPKALDRRFFLDLDIIVDAKYQKDDGTLNFFQSVQKCSHDSVNFACCMPVVCGEAIRLYDKVNKKNYTIDEVVTTMLAEEGRRSACLNSLEALFQGNLKLQCNAPNKYPPKEVIDCIRSIGNEQIITYFVNQGYIIPDECVKAIEIEKIKTYLDYSISIVGALSVVASLAATSYLIYKIFASKQGPYNGSTTEKLKRPVPREIVVAQGPNEFNNKMLKDSLYDLGTENGNYSALGLFDNYYVIPTHAKPGQIVKLRGADVKVLRAIDLHVHNGPTELTLLQLDTKERTRDIRKFIPKTIQTHKQSWLLVDNLNYPRMMFPTGTITPYGMINLSGNFRHNIMQYPYPTRSGQCGGVVVSDNKIIAMHVGGDGLNGYGAALKQSYFDFLIYEQGAIVKVERNLETINVNTKTKLRPSVFYGVFDGEKQPAVLSKFDNRCEVDFEQHLMDKYKGNKELNITENMKLAIDQYAAQLRPILPDDLCVYMEIDEVVDGVEGLEPLDLDTSAGYPYNTMGIKKRDIIPERFADKTKLREVIDKYGIMLPYTTYLKDELRKPDKIKTGKTRLIEASSMNDTIHARVVFGNLFRTFHLNPGVVTGSAVGCNPDTDWTSFFNMLGVENICEFDYTNYDASLNPVWFECLKLLLIKLGYKQEALNIIDHMCNSTHLFRNVKYVVEGGMPSGCSGTSIFNSIINNIIIKTLILDAYKGINLDFVRILAYGDDVLASYPFPINPGELAKCGVRYGLTMTPADKAGEFSVKNIYEVTFLKRRFVPDEVFPFLIHPVFPIQEIEESVRWTRNATATQEHIYSLLSLLWHSGEQQYNQFVDKCRTVPIGRALHYFDYNVLRHQWLEKF